MSKELEEETMLADFLIAYEKRFGVELIKKSHRDKPDFEVINPVTNESIGIEVTGNYQNNREAMIQHEKIENWDRFTGSSDELLRSLNYRITKKVEKLVSNVYSGRILLVIWWGSLVFFEKFDIDFIRNKITIPANNYSEIWLIIREKEDNSPSLYPLQLT